MKFRYIALHPDEDGNIVSFLDEEKLREMLEEEYFGSVNFLSEDDLDNKGTDPQYWSYCNPTTDVLLLKVDKVIVPKPVTTKWRIP